MYVRKFYERMYRGPLKGKVVPPYLYRRLKRFETTRYELASRIAPGGNAVLDIGCGNGELLLLLKDKYRQLWGVDILEPKISAAGGDASRIHTLVGDVNEPLDFPDGSFDTVTVVSVMEHIFDPYQLIRECRRLLRPGGTLIVQVPNVAWLPRRLQLLCGKLPTTSDEIGWDGGHLHYFTRASLKKFFRKEGFRVVKVTSGGIFAGLRRLWGSLLGADILIAGIKE